MATGTRAGRGAAQRACPRPSAATAGLVGAVLLVATAAALPLLTGWNVHDGVDHSRVYWLAPLHSFWEPRVGPGTVPAVAIALLGAVFGPRVALRCGWRRLLTASWVVAAGWMVSLALVDGVDGLAATLRRPSSYLVTARSTHDIGAMLAQFISHIPLDSAHHWPIHVAGHPPGALLFFVALDRLGLGDATTAGIVVTLLAATAPVAVLVTLRTLGAEHAARVAAPIVVLSPMAIWCAVSADGMFAAAAAWGLAALAVGAARRSLGWSCVAGLLLGSCVMMSYGLVVLGVLAVGVLVAARTAYPLVPAIVAALAVVLAFAAAGFAWWEAYPVLSARYWAGLGGERPAAYWIWGNLAALCLSAGPLVFAALTHAATRVREVLATSRPLLVLSTAAACSVAVADVSLMSKAEVERIWLPFAWWLVAACALLPRRWRRWGLVLQLVMALTVQHLLVTWW